MGRVGFGPHVPGKWTEIKWPNGNGQIFGIWGSGASVYAAGAGFIGKR